MVATPARIGFVTRAYRRAVSASPAVAARYGSLARETDDPLDTYFSSVDDAQIRADERQALLSPERRLFNVVIVDLEDVIGYLDAEEIPTFRYVDEKRGFDGLVIATEIVVDVMKQTAQLKVWG